MTHEDGNPAAITQLVARAESQSLTYTEQMQLARTGCLEVTEALAANPSVHGDALRILAGDPSNRAYLIRNTNLPYDVAEQILITNHGEVSPAAVIRFAERKLRASKTYDEWEERQAALNDLRAFELARQQNEDTPHPATDDPPSETAPEPIMYDPLDWARGGSQAIEHMLWNKHDWYAEAYTNSEPDTAQVEYEWLLEPWTASLAFTPAYVLERIATKLADRLIYRKSAESEYADVDQVAADLSASDVTPHIRQVLAAVAKHPNATAQALKVIATTGDPELCGIAAKSPKISLPVLKGILRMPGQANAVAQHPSNRIQKLFDQLLEVLDGEGQALLAANPGLRGMDLEELEGSTSPRLLAALASNPSHYPNSVEKLTRHPNPVVRLGAASNPALPPVVVQQLSGDPEDMVVTAVAGNPITPPEILAHLFTARPDTHEALAGNPNTPSELLSILAETGDPQIQSSVAGNPNTLGTDLDRLSGTPDHQVQWNCVNNPNASTATLQELQDTAVRRSSRLAARRRITIESGTLDAATPLELFKRAVDHRLLPTPSRTKSSKPITSAKVTMKQHR